MSCRELAGEFCRYQLLVEIISDDWRASLLGESCPDANLLRERTTDSTAAQTFLEKYSSEIRFLEGNMAKNKPIFELIGLALDAIYQENLCPQASSGREIPIETVQVSYDESLPDLCFISIQTFLTHDYDVVITKSGSVQVVSDKPKERIRFM